MLSNQIATRNIKEKDAEQAELARKLGGKVHVTDFCVLLAAYRARVQDPLTIPHRNFVLVIVEVCSAVDSFKAI